MLMLVLLTSKKLLWPSVIDGVVEQLVEGVLEDVAEKVLEDVWISPTVPYTDQTFSNKQEAREVYNSYEKNIWMKKLLTLINEFA